MAWSVAKDKSMLKRVFYSWYVNTNETYFYFHPRWSNRSTFLFDMTASTIRQMNVEYLWSKMLHISEIWGFWNIRIYIMKYLRNGTQVQMQTPFMFILIYTHKQKVLGYCCRISSICLCFDCDLAHETPWAFSTSQCHVLWKGYILEIFTFLIFGLGMLSVFMGGGFLRLWTEKKKGHRVQNHEWPQFMTLTMLPACHAWKDGACAGLQLHRQIPESQSPQNQWI